MRRSPVFVTLTLGVILSSGPGAWATQVQVSGINSLFDDYEAPDVVGSAPVANIGTWAAVTGTTQNASPPGAYQGTQFMALPVATAARHKLNPAGSGSGTVVRLDTMVYIPAGAPNDQHQMVWFNTSGVITGANNSPIHTSIRDGQLCYYNGSIYVATGAPLTYGVWQHWVIEYTVGSGQWTATIDGVTTTMGLNSRSSDVGIGSIQFFTNSSTLNPPPAPMLLDAASSPGTNDVCTNAYALAEGVTTGTTASAVRDGTASCGTSNTSPDVWYVYTATCNGQLKIDSCGSGFDTVLSVHADGCPGTTSTQLASGCSDDCGGTPCGGTASCLSVPITKGTRYLVRVAGKNGASGAFTLNTSTECVSDCPSFPQDFDTSPLGSAACWLGGQRWFDPTPGASVAVTASDARSLPNSLMATGSGTNMMIWRGYETLSSNGTDPINVSFDFKVNNYTGNLAVSPFAFNKELWGSAGTPQADPFGWPVNTNYEPAGVFSYIDEVAGAITMFAKSRADLNGQWIRWKGTLYPSTRKADVAVEVLTGPAAGTSGGVIGKDFQVAQDYYANAMDELRGSVLFSPGGSIFGPDDQLLIDNYDVKIGAPAPLPAPVNDACANAIAVTGGRTYGRTISATNDGSSSCGNSSSSPDVWYRYTAICTGQLIIKSCGSGFGVVVSVHADGCPGTDATELASGCAQGCGTALCDQFQQCLSLDVVASTTYLIRVAGVDGQTGFFGLELACAAPALNDLCASATSITDGTYTGSTLLASNDGDSSCGNSATSQDVWFRYTATCTGAASFDTTGSGFNTVLSVHSDGCPASLQTELACNDDSGGSQSSISLDVTKDSVYLVRLAGSGGASGDYTLNVSCMNPCPNPGLPQTFDTDAVDSPACWSAGPRWFGFTRDQAAVTNADARSAPNSLAVSGNGSQVQAYRDYDGQSSNGVDPVTVSFDMKVIGFTDDLTITPFIFNHALFGSAGTPHANDFGWPVDTKYTADGSFVYYEDGTPVTILATTRADVNGQWFRYTAKINTATRLTDVTIEILTGPAAGQTGTLTGMKVQYESGSDYYGDAMDELRGASFFTQSPFNTGDQILIDNFNVSVNNCNATWADADGDMDVDMDDFGEFQRCFTGSGGGLAPGYCQCFDRNKNSNVDLNDFAQFKLCANGAELPPNPLCSQ